MRILNNSGSRQGRNDFEFVDRIKGHLAFLPDVERQIQRKGVRPVI